MGKPLEENAYHQPGAIDMQDSGNGFQAKQIQNHMGGNNRMRP